MKLNHVAVSCRSVENADNFFIKILGLTKQKTSVLDAELTEAIFDIPSPCQFIYYANAFMAVEVFIPATPGDRKDDFGHLCLEVEDKKTFMQKCNDAGLEVRLIPKGAKTVVFLRDYDSNLYEIKEIT